MEATEATPGNEAGRKSDVDAVVSLRSAIDATPRGVEPDEYAFVPMDVVTHLHDLDGIAERACRFAVDTAHDLGAADMIAKTNQSAWWVGYWQALQDVREYLAGDRGAIIGHNFPG